MPSEIRHLIFSDEEVIVALGRFHRRMREKLPAGNIVKLVIRKTPSVAAELDIATDGGADRQIVRIEGERLAAALILHCSSERIPLPATAHKVLRVLGDRLAFAILVGLSPDEANGLGIPF